jgi:uncharacterized ferredoxin-like protein
MVQRLNTHMFHRSPRHIGIVGSNPTRDMDMCVCVYVAAKESYLLCIDGRVMVQTVSG